MPQTVEPALRSPVAIGDTGLAFCASTNDLTTTGRRIAAKPAFAVLYAEVAAVAVVAPVFIV